MAATNTDVLADQKKAIEKKIQAYKDMVALKNKEQAYLATQIQTLDNQSQKISSDITSKKNTISSLDNQISVLEGKIAEKTTTIDRQKQILAELLRTYYGQKSALDPEISNTFLVSSSDQVNKDTRTSEWTGDVGTKVTELTESIITLRQTLLSEEASLKNNRQQLDNARAQLEQQNQYLAANKQQKQASVQQSQAAETKYTGIISDLQRQREEIDQEIQTLEQAKVNQLDLSEIPKFGSSLFKYPVANPSLSQGYGKVGTSFAKKSYSNGFHNGLDFADTTGTPIYAVANGTVLSVGNCGRYAYGKWVAIDHGNGLVTLYGHMSKQTVSKGQTITQGKQIGLMGSTGYSTGSHVHFSVFSKNSFDITESKLVAGVMIPTGATVNPKNYLP